MELFSIPIISQLINFFLKICESHTRKEISNSIIIIIPIYETFPS